MAIKNSASFFKNLECPHFPCHKVENSEDFNCMFCYCPLYNLQDCGGNFTILEQGIKDCSNCLFPHKAQNYDQIIKKLK